ncbi:MAG: hypothetical protein ACKVP0_28465 [Pirellulaceae bacterium]
MVRLRSHALLAALLLALPAAAQEPLVREIFVPFEDLNIILENDNQRVFLSRKEYDELVVKAVSKPDVKAPHSSAVLAATYDGKLEEGRALIQGSIQIEVLNDGIQAIALDLANVGIRSAMLDGKAAPLGRNEHGQVILFVEGKGKHELKLALTALLQTSAATQTLQLTLPSTAATKFTLSVPGNVEVKAGASVISRAYDMAANVTKLELLPPRGGLAVVMSLNNKTLQDQRVVVANSVLVTEVTQGYERIHARVAHRILHGAVDKFRFTVPAGFEVTRVESPLLARWEMKSEMVAGKEARVLEAQLREPASDIVTLEISATRSPPVFENWTLPRLVPLDVAGQVAVVGLLVEDRLQTEKITPTGLLSLDAAVLASAIPETVNKAEPGAPKRVRQVVTYFAPGPDYSLSASITKQPAEMEVTTSSLLVVSDKEIRLSGQFILAPAAEDLFDFRLNVPAGWQVTSVMDAQGNPMVMEKYEEAAGAARYRVRLPGGVAAGQTRVVRFLAVNTPKSWLENWSSQKLEFPQFTVEGATMESGAVGIAVEDDLTVRPDKLTGLTPLSDEERKPLVPAGQSLSLAYRFEARPFAASLVVERTPPSLAAEIYSFFTLETDSLKAFYEIHYQVRDARTREVVFSLPEGTPKEVTIRGIDATVVKETTMTSEGGRNRWVVQLAERQRGDVGLSVQFTKAYAKSEPKGLSLPLITAEGVEHQSVLVGVEGSPELDIQVTAHPRGVDVGELYGASRYVPSPRIVGAYGYVGSKEEVKVDVLRRAQYALPAALVERAELVTRVAKNGKSQSVARYAFKTKATLLEIRLPAGSTLWSVFLDGKPTKPQREIAAGAGDSPTVPDRLLLTLPAQSDSVRRDLQIVYETRDEMSATGEVSSDAPRLFVRAESSKDAVEVPQANLVWTLILPTGYQVRRSAGTVFTQEVQPREVAAVRAAKWLWELAHVNPLPDRSASPTANAMRQYGLAKHEYSDALTYDSRTSNEAKTVESAPTAGAPPPTAMPEGDAKPQEMPADEKMKEETKSEEPAPKPAAAEPAKKPAADDPFGEERILDKTESDQKLQAGLIKARVEQEIIAARNIMASDPAGAEQSLKETAELVKLSPAIPANERSALLGQLSGAIRDARRQSGVTKESVAREKETEAQAREQLRIESQHWAEQGISSLQIDVANDTSSPAVSFHSLGEKPELRAYVVNDRRIEWAACGVGMLLFLIGVALIKHPARQKVNFVVIVMLAATVPLLLTSRLDGFSPIFDAAFFAALWLMPFYLVAWVVCRVWKWSAPKVQSLFADRDESASATSPVSATVVSSILLALLACGFAPSIAQAQLPIEIKNIKDLVPLLDPGGPVAVPKDAIIIPYDADKEDGLKNAEKVLVPYEKYVELWNRANPDKKLTAVPPPTQYALAGASYSARLDESDALLINGTMEIELYTDKPVTIPLTLVGGVLAKATLDGKAARIQVVQPAPATPNAAPAQQQQKQKAQAPNGPGGAVPEAVALLHASGKGRKKLEISIRMGLERRGGWRIVAGRLPAAAATALTLTIPAEKTEVRLSGLPDKGNYESTKANDEVQTALGADGSLSLQWRPKVAEGMVDQSLTAQSAAVVDIREDALRMVWQVKLDFGRGSRDAFKLSVPAGYLVEQVTGENIRGWQVKEENGRQTIDITLLKAATGSEGLTVQISRRGLVGQGELATFAAPDLRVESAALHQGVIAIRRSRRLDVRSITVADLARADADGQTAAVEQLANATDAAGIDLVPFQSYRFVREQFKLTLSAGKLPQETAALVRMIVRAEDRGDSLDALVEYQVKGEPLYRARIYLPAGLEIDRLSAVDASGADATIEWAVTTEEVEVAGKKEKRKLLTVHLPVGQPQRLSLKLLGKLAKRTKPNELPAPKLEVLDVQRQEGEIVVAPDRDMDVDASNLTGLERIPGMEVVGWLNEQQRPLAKMALRFRSANYAALLKFTPRTPRITATTLTNVRITPKEIQETLFFRFHVVDAGVRELAVLVPKAFEKARLPDALRQSGRVLQKIVEPATGKDGKPLAGWVKIRFVLPEFVDGQIDIGLTYDRLLTEQKQEVAIPDIVGGRLEQRLIVLENSGRDEVVVDSSKGLEQLTEGQKAWDDLTAFLGDSSIITQAFAVSPNATAPQLVFKTQVRQRAQQQQASIGLAEHLLVVDEAGTYRGQVDFKVANETEQFLDVQLPEGARLWVAIVSGEPVKPVEPTTATPGLVRIPLIKTAQGEGDYPVVLKYGGRISRVRELTQVNFPLIKVVNLNVEQSHVKLYLPKSFHWNWVEFGGTMRLVPPKVIVEEYANYWNKKIVESRQLQTSGDDYTKVRASNNLKKIEVDLYRFRSSNPNETTILDAENDKLLKEANEETGRQQEALVVDGTDNRGRLNELWSAQKQERTKNNAAALGSNFDAPNQPAAQPPVSGKPHSFNPAWFDQNSLSQKQSKVPGKDGKKGDKGGEKPGDLNGDETTNSRIAVGRSSKNSGQRFNQNPPGQKGEGKEQRTEDAQSQLELNDYSRKGDPKDGGQQGGGQQPNLNKSQQEFDNRDMQKDQLKRYSERLDTQTKQLQQQQLHKENEEQARLPQLAQDPQSYAQNGQAGRPGMPGMPGSSGPQTGGGAMPAGAMPPGGGPGIAMGGSGLPGPVRGISGMGGGGAGTPTRPVAPGAMGPPVATTATPAQSAGDPDMDSLQAANPGEPTGFASLDVEIPTDTSKYDEFLFTTPRGDLTITAHPISSFLTTRLTGIVWLAAIIAIAWVLTRRAVKNFLLLLARSPIVGLALIVLGIAALITHILPLAGLLLGILGICQLTSWLVARGTTQRAAA